QSRIPAVVAARLLVEQGVGDGEHQSFGESAVGLDLESVRAATAGVTIAGKEAAEARERPAGCIRGRKLAVPYERVAAIPGSIKDPEGGIVGREHVEVSTDDQVMQA